MREAVTDSGLDAGALDPHLVGVSLGSAVAAATSLEQEYLVLSDAGRKWLVDEEYLSPHMFDYLVPSVMPAEVAWTVGAEGPVTLVSNGCTSGLDSVGHAAALIREGSADVMLAGASDTPITPIVVACFDAIKATTPRNDDPEHASRPSITLATASCSPRAPRCSSSRHTSTRDAGVHMFTRRSPATQRGATPTT